MTAYDHTNAEDETIVLQLRDENGAIRREVDTFEEYAFHSHFLTPADAFSFTIGDEVTRTSIREDIFIGQRVSLSINGYVQASGYIERIKPVSSRSGTKLIIEGRDRLGPAVNAHVDPIAVQFNSQSTLQDVIVKVLGPFGWGGVGQIDARNDINRSVITGLAPGDTRLTASIRDAINLFTVYVNSVGPAGAKDLASRVLRAGGGNVPGVSSLISAFPANGDPNTLASQVESLLAQFDANGGTGPLRGTPTSKKGKPLKSFLAHQLKPYPNEGCFAFAARVAERFGLWIWTSADGDTLIVGEPDFTQKPIYNVTHTTSDTAGNNVISSSLDARADNQPSVIIANGWSGGGEFDRSGIHAAMVNELTGLDDSGAVKPEVEQTLLNYFPNYPQGVLPLRSQVGKARFPFAKHAPLFLHDDESKTQAELEAFLMREMALKQRDAFVAQYQFEGHSLAGVAWCVDAMANINDDINNIHTTMYVLSRSFKKSRHGGTTTDVELILPYTIEL